MSGPFLNTKGNSVLGIGICGRCSRKFPLLQLQPDRNSPGLLVCKEDNDQFDPYRLPARQPDNIVLPFNRPDVPLDVPARNCTHYILSSETPQGLQTDGLFGWAVQPALQVNSLAAAQLCDYQDGIYGGRILAMELGVTITTPGSEVVLSWPTDLPFTVDHFDVYAYYDVQNPTANDLQLITALGSGVGTYTDTHGYTINFGYTVVAVGTNGESAYSDGVTYTVPQSTPVPPLADPALDARMLFQFDLFVSTQAPDYPLNSLTSVPVTTGWGLLTASRDISCWLNNQVFWACGYNSSPSVYYADSDGSNQGTVDALYLGLPVYPQSVRAQQGGGASGSKWVTGTVDSGGIDYAFIAPMLGTADYSVDIALPPGFGIEPCIGLDANSWDGGVTAIFLMGYQSGLFTYFHRVYQYTVAGGIFTPLITSSAAGNGIGGNLARNAAGTTYVAATINTILRSADSGATWSEIASPWPGATSAPRVTCGVVNGTEVFVAILADQEDVYYSTDGITWTTVVPGLGAVWTDVIVGNDLALLVGRDSTLNSSALGVMQVLGTVTLAESGFSADPAITAAIQQVN